MCVCLLVRNLFIILLRQLQLETILAYLKANTNTKWKFVTSFSINLIKQKVWQQQNNTIDILSQSVVLVTKQNYIQIESIFSYFFHFRLVNFIWIIWSGLILFTISHCHFSFFFFPFMLALCHVVFKLTHTYKGCYAVYCQTILNISLLTQSIYSTIISHYWHYSL